MNTDQGRIITGLAMNNAADIILNDVSPLNKFRSQKSIDENAAALYGYDINVEEVDEEAERS